jgi:hypothetical protein
MLLTKARYRGLQERETGLSSVASALQPGQESLWRFKVEAMPFVQQYHLH